MALKHITTRKVRGGIEVSSVEPKMVLGVVRATGEGPLSTHDALAHLGYVMDEDTGELTQVGHSDAFDVAAAKKPKGTATSVTPDAPVMDAAAVQRIIDATLASVRANPEAFITPPAGTTPTPLRGDES